MDSCGFLWNRSRCSPTVWTCLELILYATVSFAEYDFCLLGFRSLLRSFNFLTATGPKDSGGCGPAAVAAVPLRMTFPAGVVPAPRNWVSSAAKKIGGGYWFKHLSRWVYIIEGEQTEPRAYPARLYVFYSPPPEIFTRRPRSRTFSPNDIGHFRVHAAAFGDPRCSTTKPIQTKPCGNSLFGAGQKSALDTISATDVVWRRPTFPNVYHGVAIRTRGEAECAIETGWNGRWGSEEQRAL